MKPNRRQVQLLFCFCSASVVEITGPGIPFPREFYQDHYSCLRMPIISLSLFLSFSLSLWDQVLGSELLNTSSNCSLLYLGRYLSIMIAYLSAPAIDTMHTITNTNVYTARRRRYTRC
ncbi:hypothetical protein Mapa_009947 [Marchantia paleacea]|nr:hypothetical protein Mapa_009947 [Marchantia paleacea]